MSTYKSQFLNVLSDRGFINQISQPSDALDELAQRGGLTAYIGFDCTASSLHVGSLIQIMMLYWLQQTGGRPIALMGGGTTRVGDPSGKDESRKLLTEEDIARNLDGIRAVFAKFLRFDDSVTHANWRPPNYRPITSAFAREDVYPAMMANNADWLNALNYIDFLRDVGRYFLIGRMLTYDSVKLRLERQQELSFLEFNYMILQAYDFVELYRREGCVLQMGGSDQWGNITAGIELGRRTANAKLFGLTTKLLTTSSGAKMGKTAAGAMWLNADMTGSYEYWQFWRNTEDADVERFLKLFTLLPLDEIKRLAALRDAEINDAKKKLATEATALVHGREAAEAAAATADQLFGKRAELSGTAGSRVTATGVLTITPAAGVKILSITKDELHHGVGVLKAFAEIAKLVSSKREGRDRIEQRGLRINDKVVVDQHAVLNWEDVNEDGMIRLSRGKQDVWLKPE
jgi:tyrosyl-tRNA synthetase